VPAGEVLLYVKLCLQSIFFAERFADQRLRTVCFCNPQPQAQVPALRFSGALLHVCPQSTATLLANQNHVHSKPRGSLLLSPPQNPRCQLYVTVEPCIMCAGALSLLGIGEVRG
jgi:hypothetical protein